MFEFISSHIYLDYTIRLCISFVCGFLLGLERKTNYQSIGIRTIVLISISSTLLSILSSYMSTAGFGDGDPTRIAAGVVTGIGFLGGGAILHQGMNIKGLTSAAIIFTAAAIGLCCGAGLYIPSFITLAISLISLFILQKFEHRFFPAEKIKKLRLEVINQKINEEDIKRRITEHGVIIRDLNFSYTLSDNLIILEYSIKCPDEINLTYLTSELVHLKYVLKVSLQD